MGRSPVHSGSQQAIEIKARYFVREVPGFFFGGVVALFVCLSAQGLGQGITDQHPVCLMSRRLKMNFIMKP